MYSVESVATSGALIAYALWAIERVRSLWMLATLPFVAYGLFRYQLLTQTGEGEAPERALLRSPHIAITVGLWVGTSLAILLLQRASLLPGS